MKHNVFCLDHTGHSSRAEWDTDTQAEIKDGKRVFAELQTKGFTAFAMPGGAKEAGQRLDRFDPDTSAIFVPQLQAG